jgi:hypothetical protein
MRADRRAWKFSAKRYVYFWVDGIHVQARLEDDAQCLLVIIGATPEGKKELRSRLLRRVCSSDQASLRPPMVEAESPPASLPSNATADPDPLPQGGLHRRLRGGAIAPPECPLSSIVLYQDVIGSQI